ncbi:MAG TPA: LPS export ABC transporter periplasmic protein LptC [Sphingobacteriaceae bacterium]|nr:LPS export ABC transporter periplasmic protein LptC [Sphingobacteriaceae bacterium]
MRLIPNVALLILFAIVVSCEPDLKEVDRIASIQAEEPVDVSLGVTIIFSDSAKVKARLVAPEMRNYSTLDNPYYEFQKGVTIYFFDEFGNETQQITSDYAIRRELEEIVEFRDNVVITRVDGVQIKTEELIHNEKENTFYNNAPIYGFSKDGRNTFQGASFRSDGDFKNIEVQNTTGVMYLDDSRAPGN